MTHFEEAYFFIRVVATAPCLFLNRKSSESITHKRRFGESGLSGDLRAMERGELFYLKDAYHALHHSWFLYALSVVFSLIKYARRIVVTFFYRRRKGKT
jgi:hypothetical protein